jgi:hypothetical protein
MERWIKSRGLYGESGENKKIDEFLADVIEVCKKHGLSISHEDGHGSFNIVKYDENTVDWLMDASDYTHL